MEEETGYREQQKRDLYCRGSGAVCCFLLVTLIVAAVSVAGLILSIISFAQDPGPEVSINDDRPTPSGQRQADEYDHEEEEYEPGPYNPHEIWLIQSGFDGTNLEYLDPLVGQLKGFNLDVVNAVCRKANKNCRIVLDSYSRCWTGGYGGEGLIGGWYHACSGWRITTDRLLTYKFTDPFQKLIPAYFVTSSNSNGRFDWRDLTGRRIGFLDGWFTDVGCLDKQDGIQGLPLDGDQIVVYPTSAALESALVSGEIDATFIGADVELVFRHNIVSDDISCLVEGAGIMMRKDTHLEKWWNPAWRAVFESDEYQEICDDLERVHGDKPGLSKELLCRDKI